MNAITTEPSQVGQSINGNPMPSVQPAIGPFAGLPIRDGVALAAVWSLAVIVLVVGVGAADVALGSTELSGVQPKVAFGVTLSTAGILVPSLLAQDTFALVVGVPLLIASLWLTRRGTLVGLLLWPGMLFYLLYSYLIRLLDAPIGMLFLPNVGLVVLSAYTLIGLMASIDTERVRQKLVDVVPARVVGGILIGLALLTLAQDAGGSIATTLAGGASIDPVARGVWTVDLTLEVPAVLLGGALLWRRDALGYVTGAGLLLQYGLTPLNLAATVAAQSMITAGTFDSITIVGLLVFTVVSLAPLAFFVRGAARLPIASVLDDDTPMHNQKGDSSL